MAAPTNVQEITRLMNGVVARDADAMAAFHDIALPRVKSIARHALTTAGFRPDAGTLEDAARDGVVYLIERAGAWKPGRALPWVWAQPHLRAEAFRAVGIATDEIDEDALDVPAEPVRTNVDVVDYLAVLEAAASRNPRAAERLAALASVASPRDCRIHLALEVERDGGNPRPAVTVAADYGMSPAAVRQVDKRVRDRLATPPTRPVVTALRRPAAPQTADQIVVIELADAA